MILDLYATPSIFFKNLNLKVILDLGRKKNLKFENFCEAFKKAIEKEENLDLKKFDLKICESFEPINDFNFDNYNFWKNPNR